MFDAQAAAIMDQHELDPDEVTHEDLAVTIQDEMGTLVVAREATARHVTFGRKLHYLLANLTTASARLTMCQNYESNGFETWVFVFFARQDCRKEGKWDPNETYPETYPETHPETYPETYPRNIPAKRTPKSVRC